MRLPVTFNSGVDGLFSISCSSSSSSSSMVAVVSVISSISLASPEVLISAGRSQLQPSAKTSSPSKGSAPAFESSSLGPSTTWQVGVAGEDTLVTGGDFGEVCSSVIEAGVIGDTAGLKCFLNIFKRRQRCLPLDFAWTCWMVNCLVSGSPGATLLWLQPIV